jgi:hypothetical protein
MSGTLHDTTATVPAFTREEDKGGLALFQRRNKYINLTHIGTSITSNASFGIKGDGFN